ncbi:hypothetical protein Hamer_G011491 [Homarus americanus]|uniref:Uncharacterized protein n=1 Tax=Homarus americanus TaxID=6706 RepID=A0A8J5MPF4_HOMAM|nr:hypothetical protein Hamer_G011491 [Homarus americanus]
MADKESESVSVKWDHHHSVLLQAIKEIYKKRGKQSTEGVKWKETIDPGSGDPAEKKQVMRGN